MQCRSLEEAREFIDATDHQIVALLAQRAGFVQQAACFRKDSGTDRVQHVLKRVRGMALRHALDPDRWDWGAFHERGLQLTRLLKAEVGDTYRVLYCKPVEDPAFKQDEYREVLADGTIVPFHPESGSYADSKE